MVEKVGRISQVKGGTWKRLGRVDFASLDSIKENVTSWINRKPEEKLEEIVFKTYENIDKYCAWEKNSTGDSILIPRKTKNIENAEKAQKMADSYNNAGSPLNDKDMNSVLDFLDSEGSKLDKRQTKDGKFTGYEYTIKELKYLIKNGHGIPEDATRLREQLPVMIGVQGVLFDKDENHEISLEKTLKWFDENDLPIREEIKKLEAKYKKEEEIIKAEFDNGIEAKNESRIKAGNPELTEKEVDKLWEYEIKELKGDSKKEVRRLKERLLDFTDYTKFEKSIKEENAKRRAKNGAEIAREDVEKLRAQYKYDPENKEGYSREKIRRAISSGKKFPAGVTGLKIQIKEMLQESHGHKIVESLLCQHTGIWFQNQINEQVEKQKNDKDAIFSATVATTEGNATEGKVNDGFLISYQVEEGETEKKFIFFSDMKIKFKNQIQSFQKVIGNTIGLAKGTHYSLNESLKNTIKRNYQKENAHVLGRIGTEIFGKKDGTYDEFLSRGMEVGLEKLIFHKGEVKAIMNSPTGKYLAHFREQNPNIRKKLTDTFKVHLSERVLAKEQTQKPAPDNYIGFDKTDKTPEVQQGHNQLFLEGLSKGKAPDLGGFGGLPPEPVEEKEVNDSQSGIFNTFGTPPEDSDIGGFGYPAPTPSNKPKKDTNPDGSPKPKM